MASAGMENCEWVVERCKERLSSGDRGGAKAWILTARTLYPDNFAVQYEAFCLHLSCEELKEAAKSLADLCCKFPREPKLKSYLAQLVAEVIKDQSTPTASDSSTEAQIKRELFNLLPGHAQKSVLLQAADESSEVLRRSKIRLTTLKLFPDTATTLGLDLYDVLSQKPTSEYPVMADNPYRSLLVSEVIPALVESREIAIEHPLTRSSGQTLVLKTSHLCQWLESAASFYTSLTAQALLCDRAHTSAGRVGWERLHLLFMRTAEKCGWREVIHGKQTGPHLPAKIRWLALEKLSGYNPHVQPFEAPRSVAIACFYISVFLFFEMAWEYCREMLYPTAGGERLLSSSPRPPWILVEERFTKPQMDDKQAKRRKVDEYQAFMNIQTGSRAQDQKLQESFLVGKDCWDFLQSNITYRGEFSRLCQQWGAFEWAWLASFRADMAIYKGDHKLAMQILQHEWHKIKEEERSKSQSLRFIVQMVNCAALLGDVKASCNYSSEAISLIPDPDVGRKTTPPPTQQSTQKPNAARQLKLLSCVTEDVLPFCIEVIIKTLKDVAFSDPKNERALGQLVVLLQYNWPKEEELFASVITTIQKRRRFNFPQFFKYVVIIDILEEMLYLYNCDTLQVTLLPQDSSSKSRTVTRGVNKGAREELMAAMDKQVKRWEEPVEPLLREFFQNEKLSLPSS